MDKVAKVVVRTESFRWSKQEIALQKFAKNISYIIKDKDPLLVIIHKDTFKKLVEHIVCAVCLISPTNLRKSILTPQEWQNFDLNIASLLDANIFYSISNNDERMALPIKIIKEHQIKHLCIFYDEDFIIMDVDYNDDTLPF